MLFGTAMWLIYDFLPMGFEMLMKRTEHAQKQNCLRDRGNVCEAIQF